MRKALVLFIAALVAAAMLSACAAPDEQQTETSPRAEETSPAPDATSTEEPEATPSERTLWTEEISEGTYRTTYEKAPGYDSRQNAIGPHGEQVQVFVDENVAKTLESTGMTSWPIGSKIVKDIYRGGELVQVAYMEKTDAGWYFAEWDSPAGTALADGVKVEPCEGCHRGGSDYALSFELP